MGGNAERSLGTGRMNVLRMEGGNGFAAFLAGNGLAALLRRLSELGLDVGADLVGWMPRAPANSS